MVLITLTSLTFTSCSDDDDEPLITKGKRLSQVILTEQDGSVTTFSFTYSTNGALKSIETFMPGVSDNYQNVTFSQNPLGLYVDGVEIPVEFTGKGYLSSVASIEYTSELSTFTYDKSGHLTNYTYGDGDEWCEEEFSWNSDGLLTTSNRNWGVYGLSQTDNEIKKITYSEEKNSSGIWPVSLWNILYFDEGFDCPILLQTGLLGTAPAYYPEYITIKYDKYTTSVRITHQLNSDGTLASETIRSTYSDGDSYVDRVTYLYEN